ncbi:tyrosine-type recombinase/integrase [Mycobacterium marinum]|uniref:tyrosine-type recombinase/integrase n=1 Tax=Mycobacterium marinum TaxID=1781 RepID=UPI003567899D
MRTAHRRTARPRTGLHPRDPRTRILAQSSPRQAQLRTHDPRRRQGPHPRGPHHHDPLSRATHDPPPHRSPADVLFTHHGKQLSHNAVREELNQAAHTAGLGHITPHQLRHTYATALINAGVSLQALMALPGHVSTQMSLR